MRKNKEMPKTCRFCQSGNNCDMNKQAIAEQFPVEYGMLVPVKELDLMGIKLNYRFLCYEPVYTGVKQ